MKLHLILSLVVQLAFVSHPATAQSRLHDCQGSQSDCLLSMARESLAGLTRPLLRDEAHFAIASALAGLGRLPEALEEARKIENATTRSEAQAVIVEAAAGTGDFDAAFELAMRLGDGRIGSAQIHALEALAVEQAAKGQIDDAFETVVAIANPYRRSQAQAEIALSVARQGEIATAIRTASRIGMGYWFTSDQNDNKVASGLVARNNEFDHFWFFEALSQIANIQARSGDTQAALQTARAIPDLVGRSRAIGRIAAILAEAGDIDAALTLAQQIEAPYGDQEAMVAIAIGMAQIGAFEDALQLARSIKDAYGDGAALVGVAGEKARLGDFDASVSIAEEIEDIESIQRVSARIALEFARVGRFDSTVDMLSRISDRNERFEAVQEIVVMMALEAEVETAIALAVDLSGRRDLDELVTSIALAQGRNGDIHGALETAALIEDGMFRAIAMAGLARFAY